MDKKADDSGTPVTRAHIPISQRRWIAHFRTWKRFHQGVRRTGLPFLKSLHRYQNCVLVAGCQRSGTTMLTRLLASSPGFGSLALSDDDELDAALALAGFIDLPLDRRYCFQTTYLNERFGEYRELGTEQRLIWVLRNPYSVIYSMLYNWKRFALNELYEGCGLANAESCAQRHRNVFRRTLGPTRLEKACFAYRGKVSQIAQIRSILDPKQLLILDYDSLVVDPPTELRRVFEFTGTTWHASASRFVSRDSLSKADGLAPRARQLIEELALPTYRECLALASPPAR